MFKQEDIEDIYSLSPMQQGMFFHYNMNRKSTAYFEQIDINIRGKLDINLLRESFNIVVQRYSVLRTVFTSRKLKKPRQVVLKKRTAHIYYEDISHFDETNANAYVETYKKDDKERGFNLSKDMPMRISALKTAGEAYRILLSFHHIILDGWSLGIIYQDLLQVYQRLLADEPPGQAAAPDYKEYIKWLENQDVNKGLNYWQNYLEGVEQPTILPRDSRESVQGKFQRAVYKFRINEQITGDLVSFTRDNQVTLNTIFQVLWGIQLKKYNNINDVVFGVIVSGRHSEIKDIERMVGLFVNNIPTRIRWENQSFSQLVRQVQKQELSSRSYEYLSLDQIQAHSSLKRSLIDQIMVFENYPIQDTVLNFNTHQLGFAIEGMEVYEQTNYDFVVIVCPGEQIQVDFQYNSLVYGEHLVEKIATQFQELITSAVKNPQISLEELGRIPGKRQAEILAHFNCDLEKQTAALHLEGETLQGQLMESFQKYRNNTAMEYGNRTLTYGELGKKSGAVVRWVTRSRIKKQTFYGLLLEDRLELITLAIGILRAGGVIVPFYTSYPEKRIETMINSTDIQYLIMDDINLSRFENRDPFLQQNHTILLSPDLYSNDSTPVTEAAGEQTVTYGPADQLYIHFTSGTTGTPKAIVGKNNSLLHFIRWEIQTFKITSQCRAAQFTIPGFDPFLRDIFVPLLSGGVICIPGNKDMVTDPETLVKWINRQQITLIHCVSSLFRLFSPGWLTAADFRDLQVIMLAGEKINPQDVAHWYKTFGSRIQLANCYGPTETTMSKVCYLMQESDVNRERIPIGKPIPGAKVIILDEKMNICDVLETGEICIRTPYRCLGYYNDDELNKRKFIVNPFNNDPGDIVYKSGDLGRFLPDGNIEILGRIDRQVKVRGHRIELEEIEQGLMKHPLVKEAAVIKQEVSSNNEFLCAFIIPGDNQETEQTQLPDQIKEYLHVSLPDYMVPAMIITIGHIPRKATGKIDYTKLKELLQDEWSDEDIPRDLIEERVAGLWGEILGIESIGLNRRFFDLGGTSLNVMTLISRIHKEFNIRISLVDFFNNPTIEKQARIVRETLRNEKYNSIKKAPQQEFYLLSSGQKRLYALQQTDPANTAYNLPKYFILEGHPDSQKLEEAFKKLIQRHESLRTSFELIEGEPRQKIHQHVDFKIQHYQHQENNAPGTWKQEILQNFIQPFDLAKAPLVRVGLIKITNKEFILMVDIHHIIADGTSLGILVKEFMIFYEGGELLPLNLQYKDFSQWQNSPGHEILEKSQEEYWLKEFEGFDQLPALNLRPDYPRPPLLSFQGSTMPFEIPKETVETLKRQALEQGATLFTALLTVYIIMLAKISAQDDIIVGTLTAGRNHADMEHIIGMFVNTLALRCKYNKEKTFIQLLETLNRKALEAFENQDYQFENLAKLVAAPGDKSRNPLFDIMFIMQNIKMEELNIPGLKLTPHETGNPVSKFDMTLVCLEAPDHYFFYIEYRTKLFKKEKIGRYADYFKQIVAAAVENKHIKIKDIEIVHELSYVESQDIKINFDFTSRGVD